MRAFTRHRRHAGAVRLAFAVGRAEPAARLGRRGRGLRRRSGIRTWALARYIETDVAAEGRRALGDEHFDEVFATGLPLTQRDAVAEAHALCEAAAGQSGA